MLDARLGGQQHGAGAQQGLRPREVALLAPQRREVVERERDRRVLRAELALLDGGLQAWLEPSVELPAGARGGSALLPSVRCAMCWGPTKSTDGLRSSYCGCAG